MGKGRFNMPGGGGDMGNMGNMLKQAQKMQEDLAKMQGELKEKTAEATSGGGLITAVVNGSGELSSISIKPDAVDKDDIEILEDLIVVAVNEAIRKMEAEKESQMSKITGGMPKIPGLF